MNFTTTNIKTYIWSATWIALSLAVLFFPDIALADFPAVEKRGQSEASLGNWLGSFEMYAFRGIRILIFVASALGFLWASYAALAKFNECRNGRAEWSELILLAIIVAGLMVINTLLLTTSDGIIG